MVFDIRILRISFHQTTHTHLMNNVIHETSIIHYHWEWLVLFTFIGAKAIFYLFFLNHILIIQLIIRIFRLFICVCQFNHFWTNYCWIVLCPKVSCIIEIWFSTGIALNYCIYYKLTSLGYLIIKETTRLEPYSLEVLIKGIKKYHV